MKTEFFRLIDNPDSRNGLNAAYNDFTMAVVSLCMGAASPCHPLPALSYAETELQYHKAIQSMDTGHGMYVRKALSFVRKMQRHLSASHIQVPPLHQQSRPDNHHKMARPSTVLRWTGKASDLVEILYGMAEMGCVNDGEIPIGELADTASLPISSIHCSMWRRRTATASIQTSNCARTTAAPTSSTKCRRSSTDAWIWTMRKRG